MVGSACAGWTGARTGIDHRKNSTRACIIQLLLIRQTAEGSIQIGDSHEEVDFNDAISVPVLQSIAAARGQDLSLSSNGFASSAVGERFG